VIVAVVIDYRFADDVREVTSLARVSIYQLLGMYCYYEFTG